MTTRPLDDNEWLEWNKSNEYVKCDWIFCAGGQGLAGHGCCPFGGDWDFVDCDKFITEEDYEKQTGGKF